MEVIRKVKEIEKERIFYVLKNNDDLFFKIENLDNTKNKLDAISNVDTKFFNKIKKMKDADLINLIIEFFIDKTDIV